MARTSVYRSPGVALLQWALHVARNETQQMHITFRWGNTLVNAHVEDRGDERIILRCNSGKNVVWTGKWLRTMSYGWSWY